MPTAKTIINNAATLLRVRADGTDLSSTEYTDALAALENMTASWATRAEFLYALIKATFTPTATVPMTIAASGADIAVTRPYDIKRAYYTLSGVTSPVDVVTWDKYVELTRRTWFDAGPKALCYRATNPSGEIYMTPTATTGTVGILGTGRLYSFPDLNSTNVAIPANHERFITLKLAIEIAPQYQTEPNDDLVALAQESAEMIKATAEIFP